MLFNTLLLSIGAYFISMIGQTTVEIAVFWVHDPDEVADWAQWYQVARIVAFTDPLLNPVLATVRTPVLRKKMACFIRFLSTVCIVIGCPWQYGRLLEKRWLLKSSLDHRITADITNEGRCCAVSRVDSLLFEIRHHDKTKCNPGDRVTKEKRKN
ncbi:hypothetical protein AB6A40_007776 [Gnathostoma spinigerum]|uniref:G-protein coupled receptors family 1 profile domain-containing protein n=1 Tax=Gnathostoma spinigerum TaxID=75299 RepID=A0ABD6EWX4_9BILA